MIAGGSLLATSCQFIDGRMNGGEDAEPIARVYDRYLYKEDIADLIPEGIGETDSLAVLQNYINVWAKNQLMIYKAEYNLTENKKNFERQIEEYRNDLLKFAYREEYIRQNLDTAVSEEAIRKYYRSGKNNFLLKENILRGNYMIVNLAAPNLKDAIKWFQSSEVEDHLRLEDYALKYAYRFSLRDSNWVSLESLRELMPIETSDPSEFLADNEYTELRDSTNVYLLKINDYKLEGEQAPLDYSRGVIKNILINRRKLELLDNLEQNLLNDALEKEEFEVY